MGHGHGRRRSGTRVAPPRAEVVDLLGDSGGSSGDEGGGRQAVAGDDSQQHAPVGPAAAAAVAAVAAAAPRLPQRLRARGAAYQGAYEFPSSSDVEEEGLPDGSSEQQQQPKKQQKQAAAKQQASGAKRPAGGDAKPPSKRTKKGALAPGGGASGGRKASAAGRPGVATKQTTLHSKGFGSLLLSMSQPTASLSGSLQLSASQGGAGAGAAAADSSAAAGAAAAAAAPPAAADELWVDKHEPQSVGDLVVHKRKVAEVQEWLQWYLDRRVAQPTRALLVTGPAGCGKSSTLRVLAASMGFDVHEWAPPVPTLWGDYQYQAGAGVGYSSKLDEFDMFVARSKFAALPLACSSPGKAAATQQAQQQDGPSRQQQQQQQRARQQARPKLLLVDDLPHVGDAQRRERLAAALHDLATTARCPVVVVSTSEEGGSGGAKGYGSYGGGGAGATTKGLHKDLLAALEQAGAGVISFNPITALTTVKALQAIADKEGIALEPGAAEGIAAAANGDLRNAIQSLQLLHSAQRGGAGGQGAAAAAGGKRGGKGKAPRRPKRGAPRDPEAAVAEAAVQARVAGRVGRDSHLSVFHAIGKLLHYKRQPPAAAEAAAAGAGADEQPQEQEGRAGADAPRAGGSSSSSGSLPRLTIDPEAVVQGSGLEALQVAGFLSENFPHFMAEDAAENAAAAAASLSDAAYLACRRSANAGYAGIWDEDDAAAPTMQEAAAASVAARGVLAANTRPAAPRWLPVKGPSYALPDRAAAGNLARLSEAAGRLHEPWPGAGGAAGQAALALGAQLLHAGRAERASSVLPYMQLLCRSPARLWLQRLLPASWWYVWGGAASERPAAHAGAQGNSDAAVAALQAAVAALHGGGGGGGAAATASGGGAGAEDGSGAEEAADEIEDDDSE